MRSRLFVLAVALGLAVPLMYGQATDPATLHMGFGGPGTSTPCAAGCNGGDPNVNGNVDSASVDIYQTTDAMARTIPSGQLLLILAVPDDTTNLSLTVQSETDYNPYSGTGTAGSATYNTFTPGFKSGDEIYSFLNLSGGDNSNKFSNFTKADAAGNTPSVDQTATSFGVYEFVVNSALDANGLANIVFDNPLPLGTYVVGYGCQGAGATLSGSVLSCSGNPNPFVNAFTEAGLVDDAPVPTPEPAAAVLLATIIIAISALVRRRRSRLAAEIS